MKRFLTFSLMAVFALALSCDSGTASDTKSDKGSEAKKMMKAENVPDETVSVEADVLDDLSDAAYLHLHAAREFLEAGKKGEAANEMRKGAAHLRLQAAAAEGKMEEELKKHAANFEDWAVRLDDDADLSLDDFDEAVVSSYQTLANNSYVKAADSWAEENYEVARKELDKAAQSADRGLSWAGTNIEKGYEETIDSAKQASQSAEKEAGQAKKELGGAIEDMGKTIEKWGSEIKK